MVCKHIGLVFCEVFEIFVTNYVYYDIHLIIMQSDADEFLAKVFFFQECVCVCVCKPVLQNYCLKKKNFIVET